MSLLFYFYLVAYAPYIVGGFVLLNLFLLVGYLRARKHARALAVRNGYLQATVAKHISYLTKSFDKYANSKTAIQRRDAENGFVDQMNEFLLDLDKRK